MQRQKVIARCAKSRQTPFRSVKASHAVLRRARVLVAEGDVLMDEVANRLHPRRAARRVLPNSDQAMSDSRSVSQ